MSATFVAEITKEKAKKLLSYIETQDFEISKPPHTLFSAKKKGLSLTVYESGKITVQGKEKQEFIEFYLEPEILESVAYTNLITTVDTHPHIGIDEAGKGDFFGPLCIAGLYADTNGIQELIKLGIKDSKQMTDATIKKLATKLKTSFHHEIIVIYPNKYNELYEKFKNLNQLLAWGHAKTILALHQKTHCKDVLIDQFAKEYVVENALKKQGLSDLNLSQKHRGESDPIVAAASILARNAFVEGMDKLEKHFAIPLPKGASSRVVQAGRKFVETYDKAKLQEVAKLHFKTTEEVLRHA